MKNLLFLAFIALAFMSCDTSVLVINSLQGDWNTTASTKNGNNNLVNGESWSFNQCDVGSTDCTGSTSVPSIFGTFTANFDYTIYDNGNKFSIDFNNTSLEDVNGDIVSHSSTTVKVSFTDDNGDLNEKTLTKK